ncbi:MAG TPA: aminopeptidase, partial [Gaiellaceae bacterium]|nr:aminopeptidase [Gaiellaceae bacterium]
MRDQRLGRLADLIVDYSLGLEPGKVVRIDAPPVASPLAVELYRAALVADAHPYLHVEPERHQRLLASSQQLAKRRWERMSSGELGWCGTLFPTQAHAQDAEMSLTEYERFVFRACHVEEPGDPVAHWRSVR